MMMPHLPTTPIPWAPLLLCLLTLHAPTAGRPDHSAVSRVQDDPRYGLLSPLPDHGPLPPIVQLADPPSREELADRAKVRGYAQQFRRIRHEHFRRMRVPEIRQAGLEQLREFTDPAAFDPMIEIFASEQDDVRLAMLDHFAACGEGGHAALASVAIHSTDDALRAEAARRIPSPPGPAVLQVLDTSLRSRYHRTANNAARLAASLNAVQTIPLLIFSQITFDRPAETRGDVAWFAVTTQRPYVIDLKPAVSNRAAAYQPVLGVVSEGTVLRVMDAAVVVYRTEVHRALVTLTTRDWGQSTADLGYDVRAWWRWYNGQYVPHKNRQRRLETLSSPAIPSTDSASSSGP